MTDSAVPSNLYAYSGACVPAEQDLRTWVTGVLLPAIDAYVRGASAPSGGSAQGTIDISAVTNFLYGGRFAKGSMTGDLVDVLDRAVATDQEVRRVGEAFQKAGSTGTVAVAPNTPVDRLHYTATNEVKFDAVLDMLEHQSQVDAGKTLAEKLAKNPDDKSVLATISCEPDDYVLAGLFDNLTVSQLQKLLEHPEGVEALIRVMDSGKLSDQSMASVIQALTWVAGSDYSLSHGHISTTAVAMFFKALADDPAAARNFVGALGPTNLPGLIKNVAGWIDYQNPSLSRGMQSALIHALTVGASRLEDPAQIEALVALVGKSLPADADKLKPIMPDLQKLVGLGVLAAGSPPTGDRSLWAAGLGTKIAGVLDPFLKAIKQADMNTNDQNAFLKGLMQGIALNEIPLPLALATGPEGVVGTLAYNFILNAVVSVAQSYAGADDPTGHLGLDDILKDGNVDLDVITFGRTAFAKNGQALMVSLLIANGDVRHIGDLKPVTLTGGAADQAALDEILAHPQDYQITGSGGSQPLKVYDLINDFNTAGYEEILSILKSS